MSTELFFEDFTGDTSPDRFTYGVYHRNAGWEIAGQPIHSTGWNNAIHGGSWTGDHDLSGGPPSTQRALSSGTDDFNLDELVYVARDHMMTSMGDVDGYSVVWFSPNQSFEDVSEVTFNVNLTDLGTRQWWKVGVVSEDTYNSFGPGGVLPGNDAPAFVRSDVAASNLDGDLQDEDVLIASWSGGASGGYPGGMKIGNGDTLAYSNPTPDDKMTRHPVSLKDNGDGTVTFTVAGVSTTQAGSFPEGPVRVVFYDNNYTPDKDGPVAGHTWHWDNISVLSDDPDATASPQPPVTDVNVPDNTDTDGTDTAQPNDGGDNGSTPTGSDSKPSDNGADVVDGTSGDGSGDGNVGDGGESTTSTPLFFEDFTGDTSPDRFAYGVYHRNAGWETEGQPIHSTGWNNAIHGGTWTGDHDLSGGPPSTQRALSSGTDDFHLDELVYVARDHMMTSMGDVDGYSVVWFSPNQSFEDVSEVKFNVNLTDLGARQWWKVGVVSEDTYSSFGPGGVLPGNNAPAFIRSDVAASNLDGDLQDEDVLIASWSGGASGGYAGGMKIGNGTTQAYSNPTPDDKMTRHEVSLKDNGDGTVTFTVAGVSITQAGSFPEGPVRVVFYDNNYTPDKDGPVAGHTWHWDNITVLSNEPGDTTPPPPPEPEPVPSPEPTRFTDGDDTVQLNNTGENVSALAGDDTVRGGNGNDVINGDSGNDVLLGGAGNDTLNGGAGSDSLTGQGGADSYNAGAGDDFIYIDSLDTKVDAGSGYDSVFLQDNADFNFDMGATHTERFYGGGGANRIDASTSDVGVTIVGDAGADQLIGSSHDDSLYVDAFDTLIDGGAGRDALFIHQGNGQGIIDTTLNLAGMNVEWVVGGDGNDTLFNTGSTADITISGGNGNDTITGGLGNDDLTGNAGDDVFVITNNAQSDSIIDFSKSANNHDRIDVSALGSDFDTFAEIQAAATDTAGMTHIDFDNGNHLLIHQIGIAGLNSGDFIFS